MNKSLLLVGTPSIKVPNKMMYITKKGNESIINTLTKTGKISTRDKKPVIRFDKTIDNKLTIQNEGYSKLSIKSKLATESINKKDKLKSIKIELKKIEEEIEKNKEEEERIQKYLEELEEEKNNESFLSDYLEIKKVKKERGITEEEMKYWNAMFDIINKHFKTKQIKNDFKNIKFTNKVQEYIFNWIDKKNNTGSIELSDFLVLVMFPAIKKDNKDINNLTLLLFCLEVAVELKKNIDDRHETQFNSYRITRSLINDKISGTWSYLKNVKGLQDIRLDYIEMKEGGVARRRTKL